MTGARAGNEDGIEGERSTSAVDFSGRPSSWIDDRTEKICALDEGRADRCWAAGLTTRSFTNLHTASGQRSQGSNEHGRSEHCEGRFPPNETLVLRKAILPPVLVLQFAVAHNDRRVGIGVEAGHHPRGKTHEQGKVSPTTERVEDQCFRVAELGRKPER